MSMPISPITNIVRTRTSITHSPIYPSAKEQEKEEQKEKEEHNTTQQLSQKWIKLVNRQVSVAIQYYIMQLYPMNNNKNHAKYPQNLSNRGCSYIGCGGEWIKCHVCTAWQCLCHYNEKYGPLIKKK
eukprot:389562_1